jgi:hypothetical protein
MIFRPGGILVAKRRRVELQSGTPEQGLLVDDQAAIDEEMAVRSEVHSAGGKST